MTLYVSIQYVNLLASVMQIAYKILIERKMTESTPSSIQALNTLLNSGGGAKLHKY